MASQAVDSVPHTEMLIETYKSSLLWTNLFSLLLRSSEDDKPDFTDARNGNMVLPPIIFLAGTVIAHCSKTQSDLLPAFAKLWANTDMISALSSSIVNGVLDNESQDGPPITLSLNAIFGGLKMALDRDASLLPLLVPQFPRQQVLCTLKRLTETSNPNNPRTGDRNFNADCLVLFMRLHTACVMSKGCMRRGCRQAPTARCSKCKVTYCGLECQKKDWKEHKGACAIVAATAG
jgi:hypothetical protein